MDNIYAVVLDGLVINTIVWDGESPIGQGGNQLLVKISSVGGSGGSLVTTPGRGWTYLDGEFSPPPPEEPSPEEISAQSIFTASREYDSATANIQSITEQIEDADYTGTTEGELKAKLSAWTDYRKLLRAYLKAGDGSKELPKMPSV